MAKVLNIYSKINSLRERYYKASIGNESLLNLIAETEVAEQVYNSNAIENSTLTLEETEKFFFKLIWIDSLPKEKFLKQRILHELYRT